MPLKSSGVLKVTILNSYSCPSSHVQLPFKVGEILDLSLATDPERTTFLRLPRKEVVGATGTLQKLRDAAGHLMREVLGEEIVDEVVELLVATLGRALTVEKSVPR